ncbi:MAG TPA: hypothetical protein VNO70_01450 [Blastocatellia bacterium]|nr:hypothetical protein [Blastocatellia bacterium]
MMKERKLTIPDIALIGGTRALMGAGLGLLLADKLNDDQRRAVGWTLLLVGAITTVPLALKVVGQREEFPAAARAA